jgi:Tfp pilus assembly protein PilV
VIAALVIVAGLLALAGAYCLGRAHAARAADREYRAGWEDALQRVEALRPVPPSHRPGTRAAEPSGLLVLLGGATSPGPDYRWTIAMPKRK